MDIFIALKECRSVDVIDPHASNKDTYVQLVISLGLGLSSFIAFCFLRPRWKSLYAARKQQIDDAAALPELPDTFFGWMPTLYKITEQQVLASAGLDAFVFLTFFKMAIKFLLVASVLATVIILPINNHFYGYEDPLGGGNGTTPHNESVEVLFNDSWNLSKPKHEKDQHWLWTYLIFTYIFTALAIYFMVSYTKRVIEVRQDYLGSQSTITDRTIKLSGIPKELRSEENISEILEKLEIGKVESVTLCRDWKEIDTLMDKRAHTLRKLEESWSVHVGRKQIRRDLESSVVVQQLHPPEGDEDEAPEQNEQDNLLTEASNHGINLDKPRPTTRVWYGFLKLQNKKVDAIDYYEEQLRKIDDKIQTTRKKTFKAMPLAFVTMDSIPACQMAVQALLDPVPMQLLAALAPAPSDIVWANTYLPRSNRMLRSWTITVLVIFLSIIWLIPVATFASLLNLCSIEKVFPRLAEFLSRHDITKALVQTGLPTLVVSLLNVAVPYLYDYLANLQGMISQSDVELSVISKNFFFTFFNVFLVFTAFGAATNILGTFKSIKDSLSDTTLIAYTLANSLRSLRTFYANFILLQGVGLFPLRLLEFGSVSMYPIMLMGAKTPRDYAELVQPPVFKYGFYLPTAILIFILCIVYSILPAGFMVLLFGLLYFILGYFTYKYQLLYAMDHPQHATGRAWSMICYRIMVGLGVFQLAMAGVIALQSAITPAILVIPLIPCTVWFSYFFGRTYEPLTKYIALRSIRREDNSDINIADEVLGTERPSVHLRRGSTTIDEAREKGQRFVNPSLVVPLQKMWIDSTVDDSGEGPNLEHEESTASSSSWIHEAYLTFPKYINYFTPASVPALIHTAELDENFVAIHIFITTIWFPSTLIGNSVTTTPVDNTSSQILLSRGVADPQSAPISSLELSKAAPQLAASGILDSDTDDTMSHTSAASRSVSKTADKCEEVPSRMSEHAMERAGTDGQDSPAQGFLQSGVNDVCAVEERHKVKIRRTERGRSLQRTFRIDNPLERAHSRSFKDNATIELNVKPIEQRPRRRSTFCSAFQENSIDPLANLEDTLLEPCPDDTVYTTVSDMLKHPLAVSESAVMPTAPRGDNASRGSKSPMCHQQATPQHCQGPSVDLLTFSYKYQDSALMPFKKFIRTMPTINHTTTYNSHQSTKSRIVITAAASRLPQEIIRQIYGYLNPSDFNAARHSSRLWYISSLERWILETMLKRGGWFKSFQRLLTSNYVIDLQGQVNDEWLMSKHIARECALGPDWTGIGCCILDSDLHCRNQHGETLRTSFVQISVTDFTESGVNYPGSKDGNSGSIFTVSTCGKFLMVAHGCLVYIYELNRNENDQVEHKHRQCGALRAVTSIICPRRVLCCSMDTSSQRYAIAVLMDGRMGLVCDLTSLSDRSPSFSSYKRECQEEDSFNAIPVYRAGDYCNRVSMKSSRLYEPYHISKTNTESFDSPIVTAAGSSTVASSNARQGAWQDLFQTKIKDTSDQSAAKLKDSSVVVVNEGRHLTAIQHVPVEQSVPTMYAPLCSVDDPPRSVALCPQRRCVAFGCSSGIELHWVDALTGQDLSRWFPLTAPSDYLFFLPPRAGVDSAKKLRLISSAGRPSERAVIAERFGPFAMDSPLREKSQTSPFWGALSSRHSGPWFSLGAGDSNSLQGHGRENNDHYRAIPLSDGHHILFTDPATGLLCLGSDAPIGGPTKLLRKLWFAGPPGQGTPATYAGGSDLKYGVRVVAAYGSGPEQTICLFSVPLDVFSDSMVDHGNGPLPFVNNSFGLEDANREWIKWWKSGSAQDWLDPIQGTGQALVLKKDRVWPVQLRGQEIGKCHGLIDLAIDAGPEVTIWAFSRDGLARTWQLDDGSLDGTVRKRFVIQGGAVRGGDNIGHGGMNETPSPLNGSSGSTSRAETYDGTASMHGGGVFAGCLNPSPSFFDADGDVVMTDRADHESDYGSEDSFETVAFAHDRVEIMYHNSLFAGRSYMDQIRVDGLELLEATGIARIDIDIR